jgi:hypothetical protein
MAPRVLEHPGTRPTERIGTLAVDIRESSAPHAHSSTEKHDDTIEAHYSGLERLRPHVCIEGWVFVGYIDEYGKEREVSYPCRRCADSR